LLLSAAFAMAILGLISRVHLGSFVATQIVVIFHVMLLFFYQS
jgi:hypothetical protein